jgi:hypothetical protein
MQSWRDVLKVHPACAALPPIGAAESQALGEDIRVNGLRNPIVLLRTHPTCRDGTRSVKEPELVLLDGASRLDAMDRAGLQLIKNGRLTRDLGLEAVGHECPAEAWIILDDDIDPVAAVTSLNVHRRHLSAKDKRDAIAKLIKADPSKSDRQIAETVKASPTTVGTVRAKMEAADDVSKLDTRSDSTGRAQPARRAWSSERWERHRAKKRGHMTQVPTVAKTTAPTTPKDQSFHQGTSPDSAGEIARQAADEGESDEAKQLGVLLRAWDRASEAARQKFMARVGLAPDELNIPSYLRRTGQTS